MSRVGQKSVWRGGGHKGFFCVKTATVSNYMPVFDEGL